MPRRAKALTRMSAMVRFLGFSMVLAIGLVSSGCSTSSPLPLAAEPGFVMPTVGDATDTVLRIGDAFPKLQAIDLDGNAVTLDQQLWGDRFTLIIFWSTWCGFCMQELPH